METRRIVEINGVKVEVDLRTAKRVDSFKVGDAVKVLVKDYSSYKSHFGMIVGFDEFKSLPTLVVAYVDANTWSDNPLKFVYINEKTTDTEVCHHSDLDIGVSKADVIEQFDRLIAKKEVELKELQSKKQYFESMFGHYFPNTESQNAG